MTIAISSPSSRNILSRSLNTKQQSMSVNSSQSCRVFTSNCLCSFHLSQLPRSESGAQTDNSKSASVRPAEPALMITAAQGKQKDNTHKSPACRRYKAIKRMGVSGMCSCVAVLPLQFYATSGPRALNIRAQEVVRKQQAAPGCKCTARLPDRQL